MDTAKKMAENKKKESENKYGPIPIMTDPMTGKGWSKHAFILSFYWLLIIDEPEPQAYYQAIRGTIKCGGDTDTNACIVGGLIGAYVGLQNINKEMVEKVLNFDCQRFLSSIQLM